MKQSLIGIHYSNLVKERIVIKKHLKNLRKHKQQLYTILYEAIDLERHNNISLIEFKTQILELLNTVCQEEIDFEFEEENIIYNLDSIPLG